MFGAYEYLRRSFDFAVKDDQTGEDSKSLTSQVLPLIEQKL